MIETLSTIALWMCVIMIFLIFAFVITSLPALLWGEIKDIYRWAKKK